MLAVATYDAIWFALPIAALATCTVNPQAAVLSWSLVAGAFNAVQVRHRRSVVLRVNALSSAARLHRPRELVQVAIVEAAGAPSCGQLTRQPRTAARCLPPDPTAVGKLATAELRGPRPAVC